jgi:hypothetical protein
MPFVKGQSGNPAGRGLGDKPFRNALLAALKKVDGDAEKIQRVADKLVDNALAGETAAIREIADRIDGKIPAPATIQDDVKLIVEIRSFPPLPDQSPSAAQHHQPLVIDHQPTPQPDDQIVELPPFLPKK